MIGVEGGLGRDEGGGVDEALERRGDDGSAKRFWIFWIVLSCESEVGGDWRREEIPITWCCVGKVSVRIVKRGGRKSSREMSNLGCNQEVRKNRQFHSPNVPVTLALSLSRLPNPKFSTSAT